jgi:hypothetical protein
MPRFERAFILFATIITLTACAIIPEPRRASEGGPVTLSLVRMAENAQSEPASLSLARKAVAQALTQKGVELSPKSLLELDVALSSRPPTMGLFAKPGDQTSNSSVAGEARPTRLDLCKDSIVRLTVSLINLETGKQLFRAHAEDQTCRALGEPLMKSLANEAMAGLQLSH